MVRTVTLTLSILAAATWLTGCGSNQLVAVGRTSGAIADISAGYRGVHLRDPAQRVSALLGGSLPASAEGRLANGRFPSFVPSDTEPTRDYPDASFVFLDRRVSAIVIYGLGPKPTEESASATH
jgi:hypothetical protein